MFGTAFRQIILWTLVCGLVYPLVITLLAGLLPAPPVRQLVGEDFTRPEYFWPRPSAASYNSASSSGSNFGPHEPKREQQTSRFPVDAPADLRYSSGSGLDPDITPASALYQVSRVATVRHLEASQVEQLVRSKIQGKTFGVLGHERVNVLDLNLALDHLATK
ncbi:MAG: potassium-transporting ATPase subunit C [Vulcanimicrobiota bacterium]